MRHCNIDPWGNVTIELNFSLIGPHLYARRSTLRVEGREFDYDGRWSILAIPSQVASKVGPNLPCTDRFNVKRHHVTMAIKDARQPVRTNLIGVKYRRAFEPHPAMLPE
jgi:hypothetical protein